MATPVEPPKGINSPGKHDYSMWQTLFEIDTKYVPIKPIGRGAHAIVCSSINRETNEKVAIKKIHNAFENCIDALRTLRELKLLRHLRHENVIALKDVMMPIHRRTFKDVYLVYELMDTDLHQIIKSSQALTNDHCQYFLFQLLRGLKYLHSANILHRDLKPGNLLINANCDLKICDFRLARTSSGKGEFMTEYVVTRWYRAPELLLCCDNYGTSIDVWSVGCIFAELLGRKPIFPGTECLNQLKLIINILGSQREDDLEFIDNPKARKFIKSLPYFPGTPFSWLYPNAHPLAIDLLQKMLVFDPSKRISVTEALQHPYMSSLYDSNCDPPAQVPIDLDIDEDLGEEMIREMMWKEVLHYHPEAATANVEEYASTQGSQVYADGMFDYTTQFTTEQVFKSKDELLNWVREVGKRHGLVIVIRTSDYGGGKKRPRIFLACERSGQYRGSKKLKDDGNSASRITSMKKYGCPFDMRAHRLTTNDEWTLTVLCGLHNHPPAEHLEGHSYAGRLSKDEFPCTGLDGGMDEDLKGHSLVRLGRSSPPLSRGKFSIFAPVGMSSGTLEFVNSALKKMALERDGEQSLAEYEPLQEIPQKARDKTRFSPLDKEFLEKLEGKDSSPIAKHYLEEVLSAVEKQKFSDNFSLGEQEFKSFDPMITCSCCGCSQRRNKKKEKQKWLDSLSAEEQEFISIMTTPVKLDSEGWNKKKEKQKWLDSLSPEGQELKSIKLMTNRLKLDSKQWNKKKDLLIYFILSYPMKQIADQVDCFHLCKYTSKLNPLIRTLEAALKKKDIQILRDSLTELNDLLEVSWNKFCMSNFSSELEVYLPRGWSLYNGQLEFCSSLSFPVYGKPDCPEVILNRAIASSICLVSRCIMEERMKLIAISGHGAGKAVKALKDIPEVQSKFDVVLYISVSQHHSNEEVQMDITKQIHGHEFPPGTDILLPLDEMLKPYNFLLMLDFIDGSIIDLYNLKIPFDHGCIVLATKSDDIYQIISVDLEIRMEYHLLPWELFSWHVGHVLHSSSTLQDMAIRLIEECHGHLLAMILLARALKDVADVGFWELALNELMLQPSSQVEEGMSQVMVCVLKFIWKSKGNITKRCIEHYTTYGEGRIINEASLISCWLKDCLVETKEEGEVILADLIDSFLLEHFDSALRMREETRIVLSKQIMPCMASQLTEGWMVKWNAERINLIDNGVSELPESPICSNLVFLFLQTNCDLMVIPSLFFECMPMLQVLDLSCTSIKTLPASISRLVSLQKLLLRGCELFTELPPEVGELSNLQVLDMEGTEIMYLPEEIKELKNLLLLKLSFYGYGNSYRESKLVSKMIPQGVLSDLFLLNELSIDVNPEDEEWIADLKDIICELQNLKRLTKLKLYLPKVELLKQLTVSSFRFTVGHHQQRMISRLPHEVEEEFKKHERSLRYINGEGIPTEIKKTLERTSAFFLDRHWTVKKLSEFGNANMINLKLCLLVECNELKTIIDEGRDYKCESDVDERLVLGSLEYLGIYYMKNLRSVCNGPIVKGCLSKLKFFRFRTCTSLSSIFTPGLLGNLENLEELIVEDCPKIKSLVSHESTMVESTHFLPALKKMSLLELPELVSISSGLCIAPKLERLVIFYCPKLESLSTIDSKDLKVIKGESEWWDSLMWNESEWSKSSSYCQDYLASIFVPLRRERNLKAQLAMD